MGLLISRYRKKRKPEETLEKLQKDIDSIEYSLQYSDRRQKQILGKLLVYSTFVYISAIAVMYFYAHPSTWQGRLLTLVPLIAIPLLVFYARQFVSWIYNRDIARCKAKLTALLTEKRKTLDEVMNTETYKKAKEILDKYAPEQTRTQAPPAIRAPLVVNPTGMSTPVGMKSSKAVTPSPRRTPPISATVRQQNLPAALVRPICSPVRGYLDRFVEQLIGDGPNNRYALICRNCSSHNGMALKEEFEYLAFKCVYCGFPNQSRKVGPRVSLKGSSPVRGPRRLAIDEAAHSSDSDSGVKIEEVTEDGPSPTVSDGPIVTEPESEADNDPAPVSPDAPEEPCCSSFAAPETLTS